MRTYLFLPLLLVSFAATAELNIVDGGPGGPTHVDPVTGQANVYYSTTVAGEALVTRKYPKTDAEGKFIPNYFVITTKNAAGEISEHRQVIPDTSCTDLMASNKEITSCLPYVALQVVMSEPTGGAPIPAATQLKSILLNTPTMKQDIAKYSPVDQLVVITDTTGKSTLFSSLANKSFCAMPSKLVDVDSSWNSDVLSQIKTSEVENSFMVSDHTRYYFDKNKGNWCYHFLPAKSEPICSADFNNKSFRINIAYTNPTTNTVERTDNKGIVKLGIDEVTKKPYAIIGEGEATNDVSRMPSKMDETKPVIKINLFENAGSNAVSFQSFSSINGTPGRKISVSPNFTYGTGFSATGSCGKDTCLSPPKYAIPAFNITAKQLCSENKSSFDLKDSASSELCYSCNGITPGACGADKQPLSPLAYKTKMDTLLACQAPKANAPLAPDGIEISQ